MQQADLQDAQRAMNMMMRLGLLNAPGALRHGDARRTPAGDRQDARPSPATSPSFVFPGQEPRADVTYESAWRYLVLLYDAEAAGVQVSDGEITELLESLPQFSDQSGFRRDVYVGVLRTVRLAGRGHVPLVHADVQGGQAHTLHREAVLVSDPELWMDYVYISESVRISYVRLDGSLFRPLVQVTDEELVKFYEEHKDVLPADSPDGIGYKAPSA